MGVLNTSLGRDKTLEPSGVLVDLRLILGAFVALRTSVKVELRGTGLLSYLPNLAALTVFVKGPAGADLPFSTCPGERWNTGPTLSKGELIHFIDAAATEDRAAVGLGHQHPLASENTDFVTTELWSRESL